MHLARSTLIPLMLAPLALALMLLTPATAGVAHASTSRGRPAAAAPSASRAQRPADARAACAAAKRGFARCMSLVRTNVASHRGVRPDAAPSGYGPSDLQNAYDLPSATAGSGATVAIVDAGDDPTAEADLATYRSQYGLPACTTANGCFEKVNQEGQQGNYPPQVSGWPLEESLDIDMVSAICPNCHILLVEANSNDDSDLYAAEDEAVALGARYVSNSWSEGEYSGETADDSYFDHPGVAITAAAGDDGYGVGYPAASQYVTSVGGTTLTQNASVSRGWTETVWGSASGGEGTGSGCSAYEPKPSWQSDTGCANRTVADVSAVANPATGVAVYDTTGEGGWVEVGGTSVATPVIASVYALAGQPAAGTYPAQYPYTDPSALNDVTSGANGTCAPAYLCTAGPGYDGPTGLGTPDGTAAFSGGPHGDITGQVTSARTGQPIAGVTVSDAQGYTTVTNAQGDYSLDNVLTGSYDLTASLYRYRSRSRDGITVASGSTTTVNFKLGRAPEVTVSGTVTDGSGHDWPVYAAITFPGTPLSAVYSNPQTGAYQVKLPADAAYEFDVSPVDPGYQTTYQPVTVGAASMSENVEVTVDQASCTAPGYGWDGLTQDFTGWTGATAQDGWRVTGTEQGWRFDNPGGRPVPAGGDASFAIADSAYYGQGGQQETSLVSPAVNLSGQSAPVITFDTAYFGQRGQTAEVDFSTTGGRNWARVWHSTTKNVLTPVTIAIPAAAGQPDVRVRFRFTGSDGWWWAVDNVFIGTQTCVPVAGGLVTGKVTSASGRGLDGAVITEAGPAGSTLSGPLASPQFPLGFYVLFSPRTGQRQFTVSKPGFSDAIGSVDVPANGVAVQDWALQPAS